MSEQAPRIATNLLDEPHVEGRRVSVLQLRDRVKEGGRDPEAVAAEYDLELADVYHALAYYYEHPTEMRKVRNRREQALEDVQDEVAKDRPDGVTPSS